MPAALACCKGCHPGVRTGQDARRRRCCETAKHVLTRVVERGMLTDLAVGHYALVDRRGALLLFDAWGCWGLTERGGWPYSESVACVRIGLCALRSHEIPHVCQPMVLMSHCATCMDDGTVTRCVGWYL